MGELMANEELYGQPFMEKHATASAESPELADSVLGGLYLHCYSLVTSALFQDRSVKTVLAVAREIETMHEKTSSMVTDSIQLPQHDEPEKIEMACKEGCSYCCHIRLTSTPLEAIAIAERIRTSGIAENALSELKKYEGELSELSPSDRLFKLRACPFLTDGLCNIYTIRPSACRTYHSFDVNRCISDSEDPKAMLGVPQNPVRLDIGAALFDAEEQACNELNLSHGTLEFVPAVKMVLEDPSLAQRWLNGEDCLRGAIDEPLIAYAEKCAEKMNPAQTE